MGGGDKLIRTVAEQLGREVDTLTKELTEGEPGPEILSSVKTQSESLVSEIQLSFDYFENRFGQAPVDVLISGGLSASNAFLEGLKGHLTQEIKAWSPVSELSGQFTVAYGLAQRKL